ncbi:polysaccharide biosynthesis/export family protein [Pelagicoccus sp. NFK12]|uniref:Polysaccharide biosynthesis/export family protein n=1 Tax=Pelagicoccus enzymogenes TaxID=2773457 RepID=A0A927FCJ3_9BACT|nr:polysaccharide biosynthesis/export family protein [Pelagicoccus enzymogenes]MBD5781205.1 polysaccharide biosynthesis/export family protein [Pelagicoccus enzymogenes]MDQ8198893.1 polysaccharide biosynthesis/export family protein [Pelagicoccus enzymogenes]
MARGNGEVTQLNDYEIAPLDLVTFQIYDEPDTRLVQRVSASGELRLPLIGIVNVAGLTLRDAEQKLVKMYVEQEFYINPQVLLAMQEYSQRSVSVLGQVNRPEQILFPLEAKSMNLVQAITEAGGFTRLAKIDAIQVTRQDTQGAEERITVNLEAYFESKRKNAEAKAFALLPGDIVFVPERTF